MATEIKLAVIDSDAHVIETERTYEFMREEDSAYRPTVLRPRDDEMADLLYWLFEGRAWRMNQNVGKEFPTAAREATNIRARLDHMDEMGVDAHVLYPTMFLRPLTRRPAADYAICRAYNRWLADIWAQSDNRLRWAVIPPLLSIDKAIEEINFGKENGACAVFFRGHEGDMLLSDPRLFPVYEEAQRLNLAIAVHAAAGNFGAYDLVSTTFGIETFKFPTIGSFSELVLKQIPPKFPDLRWCFIEVTSQWLPYVMNDFILRGKRLAGVTLPQNGQLMEEYNLYVGAQTIDDLDYIINRVGDDHLVIGTDYGHADTTVEIDALRKLRDDGKVSASSADKMLNYNAKRLYGL